MSAHRRIPLCELGDAPGFAEYMDRCLYDPTFGYYASGEVAFGKHEHFWTYPQRLRPLFGWMLAETARAFLEGLVEHVPSDVPLTLLELGAGDGDLAFDTLTYIDAHRESPRWRALAPRLRYTIGELSPSLRERQRERLAPFIERGEAEVRAIDARELSWEGSFYGLVFANELVDAFPCELLTLHGVDSAGTLDVARLHVTSSEDAVWSAIARGDAQLELVEVSTSDGWSGAETMPLDLARYLETLGPLVADLGRLDLLPVTLCWCPGLAGFVSRLGTLLAGSDRMGAAILVDYGGTSRHVLDPRAASAHLRVYGPQGERAHTSRVLDDPGQYDITWDVDFSELSRLGSEAGLETRFFGHQEALEREPIDLWSRLAQPYLMKGRRAEGEADPMQVLMQAHELVMRFRQAAGFRMIGLAPESVAFPAERFGASDALTDGLWTVAHVDDSVLEEALSEAGLRDPGALAAALKPGGDPVSDLSDLRRYAERDAVLRVLEERGWLRAPGKVGEGT